MNENTLFPLTSYTLPGQCPLVQLNVAQDIAELWTTSSFHWKDGMQAALEQLIPQVPNEATAQNAWQAFLAARKSRPAPAAPPAAAATVPAASTQPGAATVCVHVSNCVSFPLLRAAAFWFISLIVSAHLTT